MTIQEKSETGGSFASPKVSTGPDGAYQYRLIAWPYEIFAERTSPMPLGEGNQIQGLRLNKVLEGDQKVDLQFSAFPMGRSTFSGRVRDDRGEAIRNITVRITSTIEEVDSSRTYSNWMGYEMSFRTADGRFRISNLPEGTYKVIVTPLDNPGAYDYLHWNEYTIKGERLEAEIKIVRKLEQWGRVLFKDGSPAVLSSPANPNARFSILKRAPGEMRGSFIADVGPDGYFTFNLSADDRKAIQEGQIWLEITPTNYPSTNAGWSAPRISLDSLGASRERAGVIQIDRP